MAFSGGNQWHWVAMPSGIESLRAISCDVGSCGALKNGSLKSDDEANFKSLPRTSERSSKQCCSEIHQRNSSSKNDSSINNSSSNNNCRSNNSSDPTKTADGSVNGRRSPGGVPREASSSSSSSGQEMKGNLPG